MILLPDIWLAIIGFSLLYYAITDGFDLGVGVMALFSREKGEPGLMMDSIGGIWHINQTWLVVLGGMLFGAFPRFYSILFSALYIPSMGMLVGLILRGVAFEFREESDRPELWERIFGLGSLLAALGQGLALGGLLGGLTVREGRFAGSVWDWLTPFTLLITAGVLLGYLMLGAGYLILKTEKDFQEKCFRRAWVYGLMTFMISLTVHFWLHWKYPQAALKWTALPSFLYSAVFPLLAGLSFYFFFRSLHRRREGGPLFWNALAILFSFLGVSVALYPQIIPNVVSPLTVEAAAASPKTLMFMLAVMALLIPLIVVYTSYSYRVFSGKTKGKDGYEA
jgi:cytochrome bd ubiquinol oxidase subunit II